MCLVMVEWLFSNGICADIHIFSTLNDDVD